LHTIKIFSMSPMTMNKDQHLWYVENVTTYS
jgi:hypothetical protein